MLLPLGVAVRSLCWLSARQPVALAFLSEPLHALLELLRPLLLLDLFAGSPASKFLLRRSCSLLFPLVSFTLGHMRDLRSSLVLSFLFVLLSSDSTGWSLGSGILRVLMLAELTGRSPRASLLISGFYTLSVAVLFV